MTAPLVELPPAPRRLLRRPDVGSGQAVGRWIIRLFILPHCIVGIGLICVTLLLPVILIFGDDVPGVVTSLNTSRGKRGALNYHVHYSYAVGGANYSDSDSVKSDEYNSTRVGQPCTVRVLASLPWALPQRQSSKNPWLMLPLFLVAALFWNAILCVFLWVAWIGPWQIRRLLKYGVPVAGQVKSKTQTRGSKGSMIYQIEYVYQPTVDDQPGDASNQLLNKKMTISAKDFISAQQEQVVTVLFDPKKPKRSIVYDFADYVAVE
jgi:hypothetical protein